MKRIALLLIAVGIVSVGHLHITVDDLPWWWADASDDDMIDIAGAVLRLHGPRR